MSERDEDDASPRWRGGDRDIERAQRSLAEAVQLARAQRADRDDVVVDMKEAERARIDLLVEELRPLFEDVGPEDERFDFAVSNGRRPRLWLDATTYVAMGNDRRTYRLIRDRLHGRTVLAETGQLDLMADAASAYIAERVLERRRALEGDWEEIVERRDADASPPIGQPVVHPAAHANEAGPKRHWFKRFLLGTAQFVLGLALVAAIVLALLYFFPDAFPD